jgi:capsular exopolysaccharide synthesis family protein
MSRIYEALKRVEGTLGEEPEATVASPGADAAQASTLEEYPREAAIRSDRRAPAAQARAAEAPTPWSSSAERIVSTAQSVTTRSAPRADAAWQARLMTGPVAAGPTGRQYRRLAAVLDEAQVDRGVKTVMIASAVAGEGRTLTAANLALTLSESSDSRRVLLIDADLRHPSLHQVFSTPNRSGLAEALTREVRELPVVAITPTLSLLPAGHGTPERLSALTSERMVVLLEDVGRQFDWVLIDLPPVAMLPAARLLAHLAQAIVFVIGAGATPSPVIERAVAEMGSERIIGTVLNRVDARELAD